MGGMSKDIVKASLAVFALIILGLLSIAAPFVSPGESAETFDTANVAWMLTASGLVLLMTPGLSFFYGGMVGRKNIISTMLQSFVALGVVSLLWFTVGFSLAFGESIGGIIGDPRTFFMMKDVGLASHERLGGGLPLLLFAAFQLKFAVITPALITGAFAERVRFWGYLLFMVLFSVIIYSPLAHMTWHPDGLLFKMGVLDFAGGTVVHISAGVAALAGALFIGKRLKRDEKAPPVNIPFVLLGTGLLWFGWFGFNAGSALAADGVAVQAFMNTHLASAAAMMTWIFMDVIHRGKVSALGACIGAVVGLVAITPAAGFITLGPSLTIGFVSALVSRLALYFKNKSAIDDTLDVFPCHGVGGMSGMLLTAVFATEGGLIFGQMDLFKNHLIALVGVTVFCFVGSYFLFWLTSKLTPLRVSLEQEEEGLDLSQHAESLSVN
jgi:Amt family ammonium transporter